MGIICVIALVLLATGAFSARVIKDAQQSRRASGAKVADKAAAAQAALHAKVLVDASGSVGNAASRTNVSTGSKSSAVAGSILKNRFRMVESLWHERLVRTTHTILPEVVTESFGNAKELSLGAFGDVWKAQDVETGRLVAVKMFYTRGAFGMNQFLTWQEHGDDEVVARKLKNAVAECKMALDVQAYAEGNPKGASRLMQCYEDHTTLGTSVTGHKVGKTDPLFLVLEFAGTTTLSQWIINKQQATCPQKYPWCKGNGDCWIRSCQIETGNDSCASDPRRVALGPETEPGSMFNSVMGFNGDGGSGGKCKSDNLGPEAMKIASSEYLPRLKSVFKQLIEGLQYLMSHDDRWVHHDLKPDNIVIKESSDGTVDFLKIIDFGSMSKVSRETAAAASVSSPAIAPPEWFDYDDLFSGRSLVFYSGFNFDAPWSFDVYSAGMILDLLTTGNHFFDKLRKNTSEATVSERYDCQKHIMIYLMNQGGVPRSQLENLTAEEIYLKHPQPLNEVRSHGQVCATHLLYHNVKKKGGAEYEITGSIGHQGAVSKDALAGLKEFLLKEDNKHVAASYSEVEESDWFNTLSKMIAFDPTVRATPAQILTSKFLKNVETPTDPDYNATAAQKRCAGPASDKKDQDALVAQTGYEEGLVEPDKTTFQRLRIRVRKSWLWAVASEKERLATEAAV